MTTEQELAELRTRLATVKDDLAACAVELTDARQKLAAARQQCNHWFAQSKADAVALAELRANWFKSATEYATAIQDLRERLEQLGPGLVEVEQLEPPAAPVELLSTQQYVKAVRELGQVLDWFCEVDPFLPRLLATLRYQGETMAAPTGPMIELVEALRPVAKLAIHLAEKHGGLRPVSVGEPTGRSS